LGYTIIQNGPIKTAYEQAGIIGGRVSKLRIPGLNVNQPPETLEAFADRLAELPLVYEPGTRWSYSVALDLMGRVIEVVSGRPFDEFLAERLFVPLSMTSTFFQVPASETGRLTTNYAILAGVPLPIDLAESSVFAQPPPIPMGGSGLVSSPRDYDRFLTMLVGYGAIEGLRVMSEAAVRLATSDLMPAGAIRSGLVQGAGFGAGGRVGLGAEAGTFGWGGAAGTVGLVHMGRRLRASLFAQYMPSEAYPVHRDFPLAVLADLRAMAGE
jgi:CubicO group peptidase (beta-lactamase class C family)